MGPIALHGGGEFLPGDERFIDALLEVVAAERIRAVVLPTAAARGRPELAAAKATEALERRAAVNGRRIEVQTANVVDAASAEDRSCADLLVSADLIYLPGGDPDLVPAVLGRSTAAGRALLAARGRDAAVAGASAGAMGLTEWSWTPRGGIAGLGLVSGFAVIPHYDEVRRLAWQAKLDGLAPDGLGYLGLDERTGVISRDGDGWRVAGEGAAYWFARGSSTPEVAMHGQRIDLPV
jgi:cyanophycinase-like exopeptidase